MNSSDAWFPASRIEFCGRTKKKHPNFSKQNTDDFVRWQWPKAPSTALHHGNKILDKHQKNRNSKTGFLLSVPVLSGAHPTSPLAKISNKTEIRNLRTFHLPFGKSLTRLTRSVGDQRDTNYKGSTKSQLCDLAYTRLEGRSESGVSVTPECRGKNTPPTHGPSKQNVRRVYAEIFATHMFFVILSSQAASDFLHLPSKPDF